MPPVEPHAVAPSPEPSYALTLARGATPPALAEIRRSEIWRVSADHHFI